MTRLLLVTNDFPPKPGGIQQYLGNLVDNLDADLLVIAPADERAEPTPRVMRSDKAFMWPTKETRAWVAAEVDRFKPDAILFGAPHPLPQMGPHLGVPFGVLSHGAEVTLPAAAPGLLQLLARSLRAADVRFAVSDYTARKVSRLTGEDVVYVGAGVDVDAFRLSPDHSQNDPAIVGCVSRFVPRKGQDRLIEAAARLDRPVELLFVGTGRTEVDLRTLAADRGVRARFEVDVQWDRLPELYAEMDVFCMPCRSRWGGLEIEGFGLVYLEAAAAGLPVLAGASGGSPETVVPGETGFVVHDVDDIVEGLQILLDDPAEAEAMGRRGRARVEAQFTWPKVASRFLAGFEKVR